MLNEQAGVRLRTTVIWGILSAAIGSFTYWRFRESDIFSLSGNRVLMLDLAHYLLSLQAFWFKGLHGIYRAEAQQLVFSGDLSRPVAHAMPLGLSPVGLCVLLPFAAVANSSLRLAYALWVGMTVGLLAVQSVLLVRDTTKIRVFALALTVLGFVSFTGLSALWLGQTTFFGLGLLVMLYRNRGPERRSWLSAGITALLAVKPFYVFVAGLLLISRREWATLFTAGAIALLLTAAAAAHGGISLLADYRMVLTLFASGQVPEVYAPAFAPESMNVLTSAFSGYAEPGVLFPISNVLLLSGVLGTVILLLRCRRDSLVPVIAGLGAYLLFSPYVGAYDDLMLLFAPLALSTLGFPPLGFGSLPHLGAAIFVFNHHLVPYTPEFAAAAWTAKLLLVLFLLVTAVDRERRHAAIQPPTR